MAGIEAINIARLFSTWPIESSSLSRKEIGHYPSGTASVLHIGTHGAINTDNPLLSHIALGEEFRVLDLSAIQTQVKLLVFSACLSGLGKASLGSDVLGFSHVALREGATHILESYGKSATLPG